MIKTLPLRLPLGPGNRRWSCLVVRRVRHASNRDGTAWIWIPQRERRSAKQLL